MIQLKNKQEKWLPQGLVLFYNNLVKINILQIANLANIKIKKEETEKLQQQLNKILDYIEKLNKLDTKNIKETSQVTGLENIERKDTITPSLSQKDALSNAKDTKNNFFSVKAIFEQNENWQFKHPKNKKRIKK